MTLRRRDRFRAFPRRTVLRAATLDHLTAHGLEPLP